MSDAAPNMPKIIYSLWLDGETKAPEIVQAALRRWAELNPDYKLRVLNSDDVAKLMMGVNIPSQVLTLQTLSDIVQACLLLNGGVWVDASVFPMRPLGAWLPDRLQATGFFAFDRPGVDRPLASWFVAASPGHVIMRKWWDAILRFWSKPRTLATYDGSVVPPNPVWEVDPQGGGRQGGFPYFWMHYLFRYLLETDVDFAAHWSRCSTLSARPPHRLQELFASDQPEPEAILAAARATPVHKLDWRNTYPAEFFAIL